MTARPRAISSEVRCWASPEASTSRRSSTASIARAARAGRVAGIVELGDVAVEQAQEGDLATGLLEGPRGRDGEGPAERPAEQVQGPLGLGPGHQLGVAAAHLDQRGVAEVGIDEGAALEAVDRAEVGQVPGQRRVREHGAAGGVQAEQRRPRAGRLVERHQLGGRRGRSLEQVGQTLDGRVLQELAAG